jgi:hypothetical protein
MNVDDKIPFDMTIEIKMEAIPLIRPDFRYTEIVKYY